MYAAWPAFPLFVTLHGRGGGGEEKRRRESHQQRVEENRRSRQKKKEKKKKRKKRKLRYPTLYLFHVIGVCAQAMPRYATSPNCVRPKGEERGEGKVQRSRRHPDRADLRLQGGEEERKGEKGGGDVTFYVRPYDEREGGMGKNGGGRNRAV